MIKRKEINDSTTLRIYREDMARIVQLYYPSMELSTVYRAIDYSIQKRYSENPATISNSYNNSRMETTLLKIADYYQDRELIMTNYGTMFKKHGTVPNPFADVIQEFLELRDIHKKQMFAYPKGSEEFEYYNLLQQLDKIDANGIYGLVGQYTSLIYNVSLASSITGQGRSFVSNAGLFFESFLSNSVKFGSLNEVICFIDNTVQENRRFNDYEFLDRNISIEECFSKLILSCGFNWIPSTEDLDIVWDLLHRLSYEDINRIYYKNNLYEFMSNSRMKEYIRYIIRKLDVPYITPLDPPENIKEDMDYLLSILEEYVYYGHMYIDRLNKWDRGIKCICIISDTDSCIISLDAWYRFCLNEIIGLEKFPILERKLENPFEEIKYDEFGDLVDEDQLNPFTKVELEDVDYDFYNDEIIHIRHIDNPFEILPQDNMRYTILSIMGYVCDGLVNKYMIEVTKRNHSYRGNKNCRIRMKNEFLFKRALIIATAKKSYATIQELQEGNMIPQNMDTALDIKGIPCMLKSTMSEYTRKELKKIMYEDILNSEEINQINVLKHMAILEKNIINSLRSGSKEYYTPATVKSISAYDDPYSMYTVKSILVWNALCRDDEPKLDIEKRNGVDIAKIVINKKMLDDIEDPVLREKCNNLLETDVFKKVTEVNGKTKVTYKDINNIAIPREIPVPEWIMPFIDYDAIINANLSGFPLESINCNRLENNKVAYSNMLRI